MLPGRSRRERSISAIWIRGPTIIATSAVIRSWNAKTSAGDPSKRSAQRCAPVPPSTSWRADAERVARPSHTAFEHVADAEVARDLPHVGRLPLVGERRVAGDHREAAEAAERGDHVVHHAVGEPVLLRLAAEVGEGQHRQARNRGRFHERNCTGCGRHEPVADAWHGDDPLLPVGARSERTAQGRDLHRQVAFLDDDAGPGARQEIGLGHCAAGRFGKRGKDRGGALSDRDRCALPKQRATDRIEKERTEGERSVSHGPMIPRSGGSREAKNSPAARRAVALRGSVRSGSCPWRAARPGCSRWKPPGASRRNSAR